MPWLTHMPDVRPWVVIEHDAYVNRAFVILLQGFNHSGLAIEGEIHHVTARPGPQSDAAAFVQLGLIR